MTTAPPGAILVAMKSASQMTLAEAKDALAREERDRARGLSYSTRRLGVLRARVAELEAAYKKA